VSPGDDNPTYRQNMPMQLGAPTRVLRAETRHAANPVSSVIGRSSSPHRQAATQSPLPWLPGRLGNVAAHVVAQPGP
jgi:hypothetical protein